MTKTKISKFSYLTMMGHISTDLTQGGLPAMLPFLILAHDLSYAKAAGLVFAANLISSIVQPLFGYLGDRIQRPWFMSAGMMLAGTGIALLGLFDDYRLMILCAVVMGLGVALFHPEGSKLANFVAGENKGTGMSIFSVGGNIGFAIGPLYASAACLIFGLKGSLAFLIPAAVMSTIMLRFSKEIGRIEAGHAEKRTERIALGEKDDWKGFSTVSVMLLFRSIVSYGMTTFIPLFWIHVLLQSEAAGNIHLSIYSVGGAVATLLGGRIADRVGFRKVIRACSIALPLLVLLFALNHSLIIGTVIIMLIAAMISGAHSSIIVLGQGFLPNRIALASGILFGLTISVGGMISPVVGMIGDHFGLRVAMLTISGVAFIVLIFAFCIPKKKSV